MADTAWCWIEDVLQLLVIGIEGSSQKVLVEFFDAKYDGRSLLFKLGIFFLCSRQRSRCEPNGPTPSPEMWDKTAPMPTGDALQASSNFFSGSKYSRILADVNDSLACRKASFYSLAQDHRVCFRCNLYNGANTGQAEIWNSN